MRFFQMVIAVMGFCCTGAFAQCATCNFPFAKPHELDLMYGVQGPIYWQCTGEVSTTITLNPRSHPKGWSTAGFPCAGASTNCGTTLTGSQPYSGHYHPPDGEYACCVSAVALDDGTAVPQCASPGTCPTVTATYGTTVWWLIEAGPSACS
jgi:hypothetical protein